MEKNIWIAFNITESDGVGCTCLVEEKEMEQYLAQEADGMGWDGGDEEEEPEVVESRIVAAALTEFQEKSASREGGGHAFSISMNGADHHFQRLSKYTQFGTLYL